MTPDEQYSENLNGTRALLTTLAQRLEAHEAAQSKRTDHWGYAGDLDYVNARLAELVEFFSSGSVG